MDLFLLADPAEKNILGYLRDSLVYIAKIKEETVGGYILQPIGIATYELENIAVLPGYQNQGIGSALLQHLFENGIQHKDMLRLLIKL